MIGGYARPHELVNLLLFCEVKVAVCEVDITITIYVRSHPPVLCGSYTGGYPLFSKNFSFEKFNTFFPNFENKKKICHKYVQKRKVDPICQKCLSDYILSIGE